MLTTLAKKTTSFKKLLAGLEPNAAQISGGSVVSGAWYFLIQALVESTQKQVIVLTTGDADARLIVEQFQNNAPNEDVASVVQIPTRDRVFFKSLVHSAHLDQRRMQSLEALSREPQVVVASIEVLMDRLLDPQVFKSEGKALAVGDVLDLNELPEMLVKWGYERVELVEGPGQFSIRGGIIDVYLPIYSSPVRMELFDDEIDSIRQFNIEDQRSTDSVTEVRLCPAGEVFLNEMQRMHLIKGFDEEEKALEKRKNHLPEALEWCKRLKEGFGTDVRFDDLRKYAGYIPEFKYTVLDYCDQDAIILLTDWTRSAEKLEFEYREFMERFQLFLEKGEALPKQAEMVFSPDEALVKIQGFRCIQLSGLGQQKFTKAQCPISIMEAPSYYGKIEDLSSDLRKWMYKGYKIVLATGTEERAKRLEFDLRTEEIAMAMIPDWPDDIMAGQCFVTAVSGGSGFRYEEAKLIVLTEQELFGIQKKHKRSSKNSGRLIQSFNELQTGDLVVHEHHGVGRYLGVEQINVEGLKKDYLRIQYHGEDFLYIPIEQMELIQKYIGSEGGSFKLNRLGGADWGRTKAKAKKAIEDMTDELLKLYAERQRSTGYAYGVDTPWQVQMEENFPYEETADQLRCIEEIKRDMQTTDPMDRLLCGDVGFGKTEVALRAVFKAVMEGKQAAFLVPTTILAQQHYNTAVERFKAFPVKIEMLSRFKTKKEQDAVLLGLKAGTIDVVVGTHRLLSKDVRYKDLGFLVVDEEQRFGVRHKESLKKLKKNVDVLTLTATPIPRTLHMSLIGVRDMSVIEDPPEDRYPIQTYVVEEDPLMIREALLKEVERGGQAYFVHNRVEDIDRITGHLAERMPNVRFKYAHGQMAEHQLEKIMTAFYHHEFDVLVCTTIIETGLDIGNVNTIIINDADKLGLSQLYQLRGRVGRSNRLAYAYLIYPRNKVISEIAEKRLRAVKELVELGSGFKIAMKDLEIRGAGNLLGGEQHGHMAAIGYDLYCKMLEETVRGIKGETVELVIETTVELPADAYVPEGYIPDARQKMEIYKKIAAIHNRKDLYAVQEELEDRFGTIPVPIENLMRIAHIKALAQRLKMITVTEDLRQVVLQFHDTASIQPQMVAEGLARFDKSLAFNAGTKPYFTVRKPKNVAREALLKHLENVLEHLGSFQSKNN